MAFSELIDNRLYFFYRQLCLKVLKEALLLLFLLLAGNHEQNFFQMEQNFLQKEQKIFAMKIAFNGTESREFKVAKSFLYEFTAICGLVGPSLALSYLLWTQLGLELPIVVLYVLLWPFRVLCVLFMVFHDFVSPFHADIDPNSLGLAILIE